MTAIGRNGILAGAFPVAEAGIYLLEVEAAEAGTGEGPLRLKLSANGNDCGLRERSASDSGGFSWILPWLPQCTLSFTLEWPNLDNASRLKVCGIRLCRLTGDEWLASRTASLSAVQIPEFSRVSPVCMEGVHFDGTVAIAPLSNGRSPWDGEDGTPLWQDAEEASAGDSPVVPAVRRLPGDRWFADVRLAPDAATAIVVSRADGLPSCSRQVVWQPTNVLRSETLVIRQGDSLLLTATPEDGGQGAARLTVFGESFDLVQGENLECRFAVPGNYIVSGTYTPDNPLDPVQHGALAVTVMAGRFVASAFVATGKERVWQCPGLSAAAELETDSGVLSLHRMEADQGGSLLWLKGESQGTAIVAARLPGHGAVLDVGEVSVLAVATHKTDGYYRVLQRWPDGMTLTEGYLVLSRVPEDLSILLRISTVGTTFEDGSLVKWISAADFDEYGVCRYRMLKDATSSTSTCHSILFYQNGVQVFRQEN